MTSEVRRSLPLVVDVDGTLVKTDLLHEALLQSAAQHPWQLWRVPLWMMGGKSRLKSRLGDQVTLGIGSIPLRDETISAIREAQAQGRPVFLASASDHRYVEALAQRIGATGFFASDEGVNLAGHAKAERLVAEFGHGGFDYIGDQRVDMPVWRAAQNAIAVTASGRIERRITREFPEARIIARPRVRLMDCLLAMRPHQWAKNSLVFVPLFAGHRFEAAAIFPVLLAFLAFCAAASSAYLLNDLLDLVHDRAHPRKKSRPFASGAVPVSYGIFLSAALFLTAMAAGAAVPHLFLPVICIYLALTLAYSFVLKRKTMIDVVALGGLYTIRVLGGVTAADTTTTPWLLMFCLFLFLSLAVVKRCSELIAKQAEGKLRITGRGYRVADLPVMTSLAAAAGYGAVLVFAMYLSSTEVAFLYHHPRRLWLACPVLLYWISRMIMLANRGALHDDPVVFAMTDRVSWMCGLLLALVFAFATL